MNTEKSVPTMIVDKLTNNDREALLQISDPSKLMELAEKLSHKDNPFHSILLSSSIALEVGTVYKFGGDFWWKQYVESDEAVAAEIKNEMEVSISAALKQKEIRHTASVIESKYRDESDTVFILIDLNSISSYADLPEVSSSLQVDEQFLPNATYYKGERQIKGFRGGKTAYSVGTVPKEPNSPSVIAQQPRSGCLTRAYENAASVLNSENKIVSNGLTIQAVDGLPYHVVITGTVENKIPIVGQYDSETVSPQEYILQVMYGVFSNEPVVAIENTEFDR